ncbi:unnamed protein product [Rotaria sordida]|uniref:Helicase ATP-binding domain-containing protein n=1 Tax=Rotaria sordida TaxID=392033 RepID=A0A814ATM2_9BILA|nr:unnamed protein product [Rotaria sordida]CAF0916595.1 unnamed protein product [Rotaria sordida]
MHKAKAQLQNLKEIAELNEDPSVWWVIRLLLIILDGFNEAALWKCLSKHFDIYDDRVKKYINSLIHHSPPYYELFITQRNSLAQVLNVEEKGCIVSVPTSSGKTRIAEIAILNAMLADPYGKVLYIAPFKSLAFEIESTLENIFSNVDITISHLYGGGLFSKLDERVIDESNVIIATPEKAKAIFRGNSDIFEQVKLVIIDEGHLLGADARLLANEVFYEELRYNKEDWKAYELACIETYGIDSLWLYYAAISERHGIDFNLLITLISENQLDTLDTEDFKAENVLNVIDDSLLSLHYSNNLSGLDETDYSWVEAHFKTSLAAIQGARAANIGEQKVLDIITARVHGIETKLSGNAKQWLEMLGLNATVREKPIKIVESFIYKLAVGKTETLIPQLINDEQYLVSPDLSFIKKISSSGINFTQLNNLPGIYFKYNKVEKEWNAEVIGSTSTSVYWTGVPDCGQNGSVSVSVNLGNKKSKTVSYTVIDDTGWTYWAGNTTVQANTCKSLQLN